MFAALVPPPEALEHLDAFLDGTPGAGGSAGCRPTRCTSTLAFLEQVPERTLDDLVERLGRAAAKRTPFETADRRRQRLPERRSREGAVDRARPRRGRSHRAGPAGHRLPRRSEPRGHRGRRSQVPPASDPGPHPVPARREQLGAASRRLRRPALERGPAHPGRVASGRGPAGPAPARDRRGLPLGPAASSPGPSRCCADGRRSPRRARARRRGG